jgi:hypothetical protein
MTNPVFDVDSLSLYQSFIDEGYDGLSDSHATNEWRYNRVDSFQRDPVVSMGNTIAKRVIVLNNEEIVKPEFRLPTVAEYAFA